MARVLVTGGDGQLGRRLVRQLLARGYEVRATVLAATVAARPSRRAAWAPRLRAVVDAVRRRRSAPAGPPAGLEGLGIQVLTGDLTDPAFAALAVQGVDAVVHTANFVRSDAFENNVRATFNVATACAARADRLRRLVHVSSSAVYPNDPHVLACEYHPVDERHPLRPIGAYPTSKLVGETIVRAVAAESHLPVAIIRPSYMVGGDGLLSLWTVDTVCSIMQTGARHPASELYAPDAGKPWRDLRARARRRDQPCAATDASGNPWACRAVDPRDVAHGAICALESAAAVGETFNISAPAPASYPEAAAILAELTGREPIEYRAPVRWVYDLDDSKARTRIGYAPAWGIRRRITDALAVRRGESDGLT
jgi:nucleoside-diphosphate-sugar epimerase